MTAIVTCGEARQSLSATRALGRAHIPVAVGAMMRPNLSMWSRYASSTFIMEDAHLNAQGFAHSLAEEMRARYASVALVSTDDSFWALSRFRELLPISARRLLPPHYSVVRSLDHEALHHFAQSLGIPCAELIRIPKQTPKEELLSSIKGLKFPLLIRPIIPWVEREDGTRKINRRLVARSLEHLLQVLEEELLEHGFLISAYASRRAVSYCGVADKGKVLAEGFQERLSELEPYNEVATVAVTINPIPSIRLHAQKLLDGLHWQGPFKVEFAKDKNGSYRLVSLIGRLWGSLELSVRAGLNVPLICYRLAEGTITKDIIKNAEPHVRMRWLMGDALAKITNPKSWLLGMSDWARNLTLKDCYVMLSRPKMKAFFDVLDPDDPMPFIFEVQHKTWKRAFGEKNPFFTHHL